MIKLENVSYKYKNSDYILKDINFSVNQGEVVAIVGKNGSGKSTIGKLIAGIIKLKEGNIIIDDINISKGKNLELINKKVGIVFQNPDNQIIFNNINDEFSFILGKNKDNKDIIEKTLSYVDMAEYKNKDLYYLSLGQKQRIMIAEILAKKPKYIILDEPTTMIDSMGKDKIYQIIRNLKKNGYTIICITNLADEILLADKTIILNDGKIVSEIKIEELIDKAYIFEKYEVKIPTVLEILVKLKNNGIIIEPKDISSIDSFVDELSFKLKSGDK